MPPKPSRQASLADLHAESSPSGGLREIWTRRRWVGAGAVLAATAAGVLEAGCAPVPFLRVGAQPWPGYELMYLARERRYFSPDRVRMIELPSASASLRALATESLEGAGLTLDEVLTARSRGIDLVVVAVLDVSHGADVILGQPGLKRPTDLRHRRVGVEPGAVGALMLESMLALHGMTQSEVKVVPLAVDRHVEAFRSGKVEAVVTYEPVITLLEPLGANLLFSSAEIPGRIIDTLAVRRTVLEQQGAAISALVAGHFRALADWSREPPTCAQVMAPRLGLPPREVAGAFALLALPDAEQNHVWLGQGGARLMAAASAMSLVMRRSGLLPNQAEAEASAGLGTLADARFLPTRG